MIMLTQLEDVLGESVRSQQLVCIEVVCETPTVIRIQYVMNISGRKLIYLSLSPYCMKEHGFGSVDYARDALTESVK